MEEVGLKRLTGDALDRYFGTLLDRFQIWAPVCIPAGGRYQGQDAVQYKPVSNWRDIVWDRRSDYSSREAILPITQTLYTFTGDDYREVKPKQAKDLLILARSCDIHAIRHLDEIFLQNGGYEDSFYRRVRDKVHFALMECTHEFDGCFCVSLGTNDTDDYAMRLAFDDEGIFFEAKDPSLDCADATPSDRAFSNPTENELKVEFPEFRSIEEVNELKSHPMWDEYNSRCISCGACTIACSTCTCFETRDIVYSLNHHVGERRRTASSCMVAGFDAVAGSKGIRLEAKDRYRYKIMHKIYAHDARFHTGPMCVGCNRCSAHCPQLISYPATINKVSQALREIREQEVGYGE